MKILFIGLGSIGQRHLQNLKNMNGFVKLDIYCLRYSSHNLFIKNGIANEVDNLMSFYEIKDVKNLSDAIILHPDIVFVTNPSAMHMDYAIQFASIGSHLFIEKPLSSSLNRIEELKELVVKNNIICMVGYQQRFHPLLKELKNILIQKKYGNILNAQLEWGTYLPSHHPYEDYKHSYASRKDLGGGVILSLIHELDILLFLFGKPKDYFVVEGQNSSLEIEEEDTVISLFKYLQDNKSIPISLSISFSQVFETRSIKISFEKAFLELDWQKNELIVRNNNQVLIHSKLPSSFSRNDMFIDELYYFFKAIENKNFEISPSLQEGVDSLELALNMKEKII